MPHSPSKHIVDRETLQPVLVYLGYNLLLSHSQSLICSHQFNCFVVDIFLI